MPMYLSTRRVEGALVLALQGRWRLLDAAAISGELAAFDPGGERRLVVDTRGVESLDLSSAWLLEQRLAELEGAGVDVQFHGDPPGQLTLVREAQAAGQDATPEPRQRTPLNVLGHRAVARARSFKGGIEFIGRVSLALGHAAGTPRRLRPTSVARHVYETGITAIPIVALIAFLISVIIAYMSAEQLRALGAEIYVVDLVTIGVLRELGVLLTAIIVAGRSGSAFAAEIGAMKLNEEVDALQATGVEPIEVLVIPRVIGLVIALPLLTVIADAIGLTGGALLCRSLLDMSIEQYLQRMNDAIAPTTFWAGIIKAPVFALLIALSGTYRGLQVRGSSRELGRLTTVAVVQSIFLVILADALFAVVFLEIGI